MKVERDGDDKNLTHEEALVASGVGRFAPLVDRCVHYAEGRICKFVHDKLEGKH